MVGYSIDLKVKLEVGTGFGNVTTLDIKLGKIITVDEYEGATAALEKALEHVKDIIPTGKIITIDSIQVSRF